MQSEILLIKSIPISTKHISLKVGLNKKLHIVVKVLILPV